MKGDTAIDNISSKNITTEFEQEESPYVSVPGLEATNIEDYHEHLEGMEITEEQAAELIHILFDIMRTMIDINFGLNSVQFTANPQETMTTSPRESEVTSDQSQKHLEFNGAVENKLSERSPS